jgi:hypothetical protein
VRFRRETDALRSRVEKTGNAQLVDNNTGRFATATLKQIFEMAVVMQTAATRKLQEFGRNNR